MMGLDGMQLQFGSTRIQFFRRGRKTIWHSNRQRFRHTLVTIDIDITIFAERTQVVYSPYMVIVFMGNQQPIYFSERHSEHLLPDIRTGIYQQPGALCLYHGSAPQPLVLRISTATHVTLTAQSRHPTRGTRS